MYPADIMEKNNMTGTERHKKFSWPERVNPSQWRLVLDLPTQSEGRHRL